ncbi:hypothetical protein K440107A6_28720 [Lawsonibacter asaccharolyticus]
MSVVLPAPKNPEIMSILVMVTQILSSNKAAGPPDGQRGKGERRIPEPGIRRIAVREITSAGR